jgi:hypothetical protein
MKNKYIKIKLTYSNLGAAKLPKRIVGAKVEIAIKK